MELNIRGEKIVVTKAIKDYVMEKLSKLDKYFDSERDFKINVLIKVPGWSGGRIACNVYKMCVTEIHGQNV